MKLNSSKAILTSSVAVLCIALVPSNIFSAANTLSGAAPAWATPANWSAGAIPTAADNVIITATGAADVRGSSLGGTTTIQDLQFNSTAAASLVNASTSQGMVLVLNGGRGAGTPLISTLGNFAYAITGVGTGAPANPLALRLDASGNIDVATNVLTISSIISETGGARSINKTNAGRLILSGANTFTGGVTATAGILEGASFGAFGTGPAVVASGGTIEVNIANANYTASSITVNTGGRLAVRNLTLTNAVTLAGGNLATRSGDAGTFSGPINVTADSTATLISYTTVANNQSISITGKLSGSSSLTVAGNLTNANAATGATPVGQKALILTNTTNDFSGVFNVNQFQRLHNVPATTGKTIGTASVNLTGGILRLNDNGTGSNGTLSYGNNITVGANGGTIELDRVSGVNTGNTFALGSLSIGNVALAVNTANGYKASFTGGTLTGDATVNSAADLTVSGAITGAFGITKSGAGSLTLGGANTYTGASTISGGPLVLNGSLAGPLSMGAGLALSGIGSAGATTIGNGGIINPGTANVGTLTMSALTFGAAATDNAIVNFSTGSSINVTGANGLFANSDGTGVNVVTLNLLTALPAIGTYTIIDYNGTIGGTGFGAFKLGTLPNPRISATLNNDLVATRIYLDVTAVDTPKWTGTQTSEWSTASIAGAKNWKLVTGNTSTDYIAGDNVLFDDSATSASPNLTENVSPTSVVFNNSVAKPYTLTGAFAIGGTGSLTKTNTGTVLISNTNSFTGPVNINGGKVTVDTLANGTANSPLGAGTIINFANGGVLELTGAAISSDRSINANTGGGTINVPAASTTTLAGPIGGSDVLTVNNDGNLTISGPLGGNATVIGGGATTVSGLVSGILTAGSSNATTVSGVVTGTLIKSGSGTATITGITNTPSGIIVSAGTLQVGDGVVAGSTGAGLLTNNASVVFNTQAAGTLTVANQITGTGTLSKIGAGTTTLSGATANDYTGTTTVSAGSLVLSKTTGIDAIGGDLFVEAGGIVAYGTTAGQLANHIKDTASVTINGGTFGSGAGNTEAAPTTGVFDTVATVSLNSGTFLSGRGDATPFTVTGAFAANGGRALLSRGGSLSVGSATLESGATFEMDGGSTGILSQFIIGAGGLTIRGAAVNLNTGPSAITATSRGSSIVLSGNLTTTGVTTVSRVNSTQLAPLAQFDLNGGTRIFDVTGSLTLGTAALPVSVVNSVATPGGITKSGTGDLVLNGTNTYNGDTIIQAGKIILSGTLSGSANIDVQTSTFFDVTALVAGFPLGATQTLKGNGTVLGDVVANGTVSPGASIGALVFTDDLTFGTTGIANFEVKKVGVTLSNDEAFITNSLTLAGTLNVALDPLSGALAEGDTFDLFDATTFAGTMNLGSTGLPSNLTWDLTNLGVDGSITVVPEPGSAALLVLGSALLFRRRRNA